MVNIIGLIVGIYNLCQEYNFLHILHVVSLKIVAVLLDESGTSSKELFWFRGCVYSGCVIYS